nr:AAA family ATPase [Pseudomonas aeruginosa]
MTEVIERQVTALSKKQRFSPLPVEALEAMPPQQWRIKGVFPIEGLAVVYGASTAGKSFLSLEMAASIGDGLPFFEHATKPAAVLYVGLEGEGGYRGRVVAWQRHHGRAIPDSVRFLLQPFRLTDPQDVADLAAVCPPGCVVFIDTLNRAAPGMDENSSRDMGAVIEGAKTLQRLIGGLVVLVAHTGKDSAKGLRGHSSLFAALDGEPAEFGKNRTLRFSGQS